MATQQELGLVCSYEQQSCEADLLRGCAATAMLSIALGLTVPVGWYSHTFQLLPALDGSPAMQPNSALGFVLCGAALPVAQRKRPKATLVTGAANPAMPLRAPAAAALRT